MLSGYFYSHYKFQFTPLREGRRIPHVRLVEAQMISIHAPPRGATACAAPSPAQSRYFNSRPSARGDLTRDEVWNIWRISIHAPPRGATWRFRQRCKHHHISIHAPPRGATETVVVPFSA